MALQPLMDNFTNWIWSSVEGQDIHATRRKY